VDTRTLIEEYRDAIIEYINGRLDFETYKSRVLDLFHDDGKFDIFFVREGRYLTLSAQEALDVTRDHPTSGMKFRYIKMVVEGDFGFLHIEQYGDSTYTPGGQNLTEPYSFDHIQEFRIEDGKIMHIKGHVDTYRGMILSGRAIMTRNDREEVRGYMKMLLQSGIINEDMISERFS
jgi:hypothetical protein